MEVRTVRNLWSDWKGKRCRRGALVLRLNGLDAAALLKQNFNLLENEPPI